jgi:hypothetical protein
MAVQKQDGLHTDQGVSNADLTGDEFKFCKRNADGTIDLCGDGGHIAGVISEGKAAGYHTSFNTRGNPILKVISGGQISRGDQVQSGAGGLAKSGAANAFGHARNNAVDGEMVEVETYSS